MKYTFLALVVLFMACGDGNNDNNNPELRDPSAIQPPEEAIPDTMTIQQDSLITPDTSTGSDTTKTP